VVQVSYTDRLCLHLTPGRASDDALLLRHSHRHCDATALCPAGTNVFSLRSAIVSPSLISFVLLPGCQAPADRLIVEWGADTDIGGNNKKENQDVSLFHEGYLGEPSR